MGLLATLLDNSNLELLEERQQGLYRKNVSKGEKARLKTRDGCLTFQVEAKLGNVCLSLVLRKKIEQLERYYDITLSGLNQLMFHKYFGEDNEGLMLAIALNIIS